MMRAIRVAEKGGPDVLKVANVPVPSVTASSVLVKVKAVGINPVETYIRSGNYARMPAFPYTPGNDASGVVEAAGAEVTHVSRGDRVYITSSLTGAYAEYTLADGKHVRKIPSKLTFEQAAAVPVPYYTAHRALFHSGRATAGQTVLVHGATGGVGIACLQLAKAAGLTVIGTAGSAAGEAAIAPYCHHVLRHGDGPALVQAVLELTGRLASSGSGGPGASNASSSTAATPAGPGVDLIIEMRADLNLGHDLKMVRGHSPAATPATASGTRHSPATAVSGAGGAGQEAGQQAGGAAAGASSSGGGGGTVVIVGSRGDVSLSPRDIMARECTVTGVMLWYATDEDWRVAEAHLHAGFESGTLSPVVGIALKGLESGPEAHDEVLSHSRTGGSAGKVVISLE